MFITVDKSTAEIDDCRALSEKSELISSDEKDCSEKPTTRECGDNASKETVSVSTPVKDDDMANRSEMVYSVKTADSNSHPVPVLVSREPKPSVSVEEESSLQEQVGNSEATEDEIIVQNPTQDPNVQEQIGMQNGDGTNIVPPTQVHDTLPSHLQVQVSETKSFSCVDLQNGCENATDVISLEVQAPPNVPCKTTVSSDNPLSPCAVEVQSLDAPHIAVRLEKSSAEFSGGKECSCVSEK